MPVVEFVEHFYPPYFTVQPAPQEAPGEATFVTLALAYYPPTYQWQEYKFLRLPERE